MNSQLIHQYKIGKLKLDINNINNNFEKVKYVKIENLIDDLIQFKEEIDKISLNFNKGKEVEQNEPTKIHT